MNKIGKWRLPTIQELKSIVDYTKYNPATNLKDIKSSHYWSSTSCAIDSSSAWDVGFYYGGDYEGYKGGSRYVRCVRTLEDSSLEWAKEDAPKQMTWQEAMDYAESLNIETKEITIDEIENLLGYKVKIVKDK